jgi:hypothetical protein
MSWQMEEEACSIRRRSFAAQKMPAKQAYSADMPNRPARAARHKRRHTHPPRHRNTPLVARYAIELLNRMWLPECLHASAELCP